MLIRALLTLSLLFSSVSSQAAWYTLKNFPTHRPSNWTYQAFYDDGTMKNKVDPKVLKHTFKWKQPYSDPESNMNHVFWSIPKSKKHPNWKVRKYYRDPKISAKEYKAAKFWLNDERFKSYNVIARVSKAEQVIRVYHRPCWEAKTCKGLVYKWKVSTGVPVAGGVETPTGFFVPGFNRVTKRVKEEIQRPPRVEPPNTNPPDAGEYMIGSKVQIPLPQMSDAARKKILAEKAAAQAELKANPNAEVKSELKSTIDSENTADTEEVTTTETTSTENETPVRKSKIWEAPYVTMPDSIPLPVRSPLPRYRKVRKTFQMGGRAFSSRHVSRTIYRKQGIVAPMPWATFFNGGIASHGTPFISKLGRKASHGCIRLEEFRAQELFHLVGQSGFGKVQAIERNTGKPLDQYFDSYKAIFIVEKGSLNESGNEKAKRRRVTKPVRRRKPKRRRSYYNSSYGGW